MYDFTATKFTSEFYASFEENKKYKIAFLHAVNRMDSGRLPEASLHEAHLHPDAVDYVCLLSQDGDEFPDTGHISTRMLRQ